MKEGPMFKISLIGLTFILSACSTPMKETVDLTKLKPDQRAYAGNIQVHLNDLTNDKLTCDLFLNSDISPTIRLSPDGNYQFKSTKKKLAFSKIACVYKIKNEKYWVNHSLDIPRVAQLDESKAKEVFNMGYLTLNWKVADSEVSTEKNPVFNSEDKMRDIGKIEIKTTTAPTSPQL
jgi:hypothetical protein